MDDKCYFCNELKEWLEIDKENARTKNYSARLVRHGGNGEWYAKRITESVLLPICYCPMCGKKIDFKALRENAKGDD